MGPDFHGREVDRRQHIPVSFEKRFPCRLSLTVKLDGGLPECFPPALRHRVTPDGELTEERTEPIAADVRPGGDGKQTAKLRLLAGLLGVGFDELKRRERQRVIRRRIQWTCLALAVVMLLFGVWQWQEQRRREQARQEQIEQLIEAGRHVSCGFDGTVRLWDVHLESRKPEVVADLVQDRVPLRIVEGRLVPK